MKIAWFAFVLFFLSCFNWIKVQKFLPGGLSEKEFLQDVLQRKISLEDKVNMINEHLMVYKMAALHYIKIERDWATIHTALTLRGIYEAYRDNEYAPPTFTGKGKSEWKNVARVNQWKALFAYVKDKDIQSLYSRFHLVKQTSDKFGELGVTDPNSMAELTGRIIEDLNETIHNYEEYGIDDKNLFKKDHVRAKVCEFVYDKFQFG